MQAPSKHFKHQASIWGTKQAFEAASKHLKQQANIWNSKYLKQGAVVAEWLEQSLVACLQLDTIGLRVRIPPGWDTWAKVWDSSVGTAGKPPHNQHVTGTLPTSNMLNIEKVSG